MKTVKQLSILTSLAAVSLLSGCDIAEDTCTTDADCDTAAGEICANIDEATSEGTCEAPADGSGSGSGSGSGADCSTDPTICTDGQQCDDGVCASFVYVALVSRGVETPNETNTPGPDIDAIAVLKGGVPSFASEVVKFVSGPETNSGNDNSDPSKLLGSNDAMSDTSGDKCDLDGLANANNSGEPNGRADDSAATFTSLGFQGGFVIVRMPVSIVDGDVISVYELGSVWCDNIMRDRADAYDIYVGLSSVQVEGFNSAADFSVIGNGFQSLGADPAANGGIYKKTFSF
jgi:hypothetical protein